MIEASATMVDISVPSGHLHGRINVTARSHHYGLGHNQFLMIHKLFLANDLASGQTIKMMKVTKVGQII